MPKNLTDLARTPLTDTIADFIDFHRDDRRHHTNTSKKYTQILTVFLTFCEKEKIHNPADLDITKINNFFKNIIRQNPDFTKKSENYYKIVLRSLFRFCEDNDIPSLPAIKIKLKKQLEKDISKDILTAEEIENILQNIDREENKREKPDFVTANRDKIIFALLFECCLRVSELRSLNRTDFDFTERQITVRTKGGKLTTVYFSTKTRDLLQKYFALRTDNSPAVFINSRGKGYWKHRKEGILDEMRLTQRGIAKILERRVKTLENHRKIHPHLLRHSGLTNFLRKGLNIVECQKIANHASITTTRRYLKIVDKDLKNKVDNILG